jgi:hypothetical protein
MNDPETDADEAASDRESDRTWDDIDSDPPSPIDDPYEPFFDPCDPY